MWPYLLFCYIRRLAFHCTLPFRIAGEQNLKWERSAEALQNCILNLTVQSNEPHWFTNIFNSQVLGSWNFAPRRTTWEVDGISTVEIIICHLLQEAFSNCQGIFIVCVSFAKPLGSNGYVLARTLKGSKLELFRRNIIYIFSWNVQKVTPFIERNVDLCCDIQWAI